MKTKTRAQRELAQRRVRGIPGGTPAPLGAVHGRHIVDHMRADHEGRRRHTHAQLSSVNPGGGSGATIREPFDPLSAYGADPKTRSRHGLALQVCGLIVRKPKKATKKGPRFDAC